MRASWTGRIQAPPIAVRSSATVSAWTLVSRITGAGRVIVIGAVLGPTFFANTFVATNTVPNLVYLSILGSVLGPVVVPAIVRTATETGTRGAADLLGRLAGFLLLVMGAASLAMLIGSPLIARLLTAGIADAAIRSRGKDLALVMLLFVAPQVMFYIIAALGAAAQQARGRFALANAAPAVENIGVMATVALTGLMYASRVEMDDAPLGLAIMLCVGSTLSVALHMTLQLVGAARAGLPIRPRMWRRSDPLTVEITARMRRSFVIAACPQATYFTLIASAATVAGGVLVFQIAWAVYWTLVALGARAVGTAVLPRLSDAAHGNDRKAFADSVRQGMAYTFIASLPPLFLVVAFAWPIADVLANGELRIGDLIRTLAGCIAVLAVAQLAAGLYEVGRQALFARLDIRGPRIAALLGLGVTLSAGSVGVARVRRHRSADRVDGGCARRGHHGGGHRYYSAAAGLAPRGARRPQAAGCRSAGVSRHAACGGRRLACCRCSPEWPFRESADCRTDFDARAGSVRDGAARRHLASGGDGMIVDVRGGKSVLSVKVPLKWGAIAGPAVAAALAAGLLAAAAGPIVVAIAGVVGLFALVAWRPVLAAYLYLATLPFIAGIERGTLLPLVRPNEALLVLLTAGVVAGGYIRLLRGAPLQLRFRPLDVPLATFVLLATVWPIGLMLLRGVLPAESDVMAVLPVCKLAGLLLLVRITVSTSTHVLWCIRLIIGGAVGIATIAILQTLSFGPVLALLRLIDPRPTT